MEPDSHPSMRDGVCRQCRATSVYMMRGGLTAARHDVNLRLPTTASLDATIGLAVYVCASCGYVESYVANQQHLNQIIHSEHWEHVRA